MPDSISPTFRKNRDNGLDVWFGPTRRWIDEDDPENSYGYTYDVPLPPDLTFTREQCNEILAVLLQGPIGPVGPMGAPGLSYGDPHA